MAVSGSAIVVTYYAWDTVNNVGKTGDVANHTLRVDRDGSQITPAGSPAQVDATNCPGLYRIALTAGEHTGHSFTLHGKSSTANISIVPHAWTAVTCITMQNIADALDLAPTGDAPAAKSVNKRLKTIRAKVAGSITATGTTVQAFKAEDKSTTEVTETLDANGNRIES